MSERLVHEGRNVKRIREILGVKQDALAIEMGLSQQAISALEQKEALDRDVLEKIANVLKVSVEAIKNFTEETVINVVQNNYDGSTNNNSCYQYTFNPIEKLLEQFEEIKRLNDALLKEKDAKIALLEKLLNK